MSRDKRVIATARVQVTIDIPVPDSWGGDCDVAQIQRQAKVSVGHVLRKVIETKECIAGKDDRISRHTELGILLDSGKAQIIDAKVKFVLVEEDR